MKIVLKRKRWNSLENAELTEETTDFAFVNIQEGQKWSEFLDYYSSKSKVRGKMETVLNFSFEVKKINEDSVVLELDGEATKKVNEITLEFNQEKEFTKKTKYCRVSYMLTLCEDDECAKKMPFKEFNLLFKLNKYITDFFQVSIWSPIIYEMEDKYYAASVNFLKNHTITQLNWNEITITKILKGYWPNKQNEKEHYLEALIILNNIEKMGKENAYHIYTPRAID